MTTTGLFLLASLMSVADPVSTTSPHSPPALPHPRTLHSRLLEAEVVLIARWTKVAPRVTPGIPEASFGGGNSFRLDIKRVLMDRNPGDSLAKYPTLGDLIPGSSIGGLTHPVPTDRDVLVFAHRGSFYQRLHLLSCCTNSVVPLVGILREFPGPQYETERIPAKAFVELVEKLIG